MYHYVYKHKHLFCFQQGFYSNAKKGQASSSSSSPTTSNESVSPKAASFVVKRTYIVTTDQNKPFSETPSPNNYITWDLHNHMMFFFLYPPNHVNVLIILFDFFFSTWEKAPSPFCLQPFHEVSAKEMCTSFLFNKVYSCKCLLL